MSSNLHKQNQHYVPQFILRRFHNEDKQLHVYDKWTRRSFVSSTRNVASEKGFYNIEIDGEVVISLEPVMCEIENHALEAINSLIDNASLTSISAEQKHAVAYFFATQLVRTRFMRDTLKHIQDEFRKILPKKNLEESQLPEDFFMDDEQLKISSLINLRSATELVPQILNKTWLLSQAPSKETFLISDNPLVRYNEQQSPLVGTNGLACPGIQVHMPLSR